jgi:hypothetical protein
MNWLYRLHGGSAHYRGQRQASRIISQQFTKVLMIHGLVLMSMEPYAKHGRKALLIFPRFGGLPTVSVRGVHYGQVQDLEEVYA